MLAVGFFVPMMFVVGGIFVVLWVVALRLGGRIDRERAEYDAAHPRGGRARTSGRTRHRVAAP